MPCGKMLRFAFRLLPQRAALGWGQYPYNIIRLFLLDNNLFELYAATSARPVRMLYVLIGTCSLLVGLLFKALLILIP